jgi:hypothetical protein
MVLPQKLLDLSKLVAMGWRPRIPETSSHALNRLVSACRFGFVCLRSRELCNTEAHTFKGVLAKLRCAARCIRDTVPPTNDPKLTCDIELRLVFSLERDLERLLD